MSHDDVLADATCRRRLIGLVPENNGGFGSAKDAMATVYEMQVMPLALKFTAANEWLGDEVIAFERPV